ncbi:unnamed protein product, partial [Mesorhabditis spiculigera]
MADDPELKDVLKQLAAANQQMTAVMVAGQEREAKLMAELERIRAEVQTHTDSVSEDSSQTQRPLNAVELGALATRISRFEYDPSQGITFEKWHERFTNLIATESRISEENKKHLVLGMLDAKSYGLLADHARPKELASIAYDDIVKHLTEMFGEKLSLFSRRFLAFRVAKEHDEDMRSYAARVNKLYEQGCFKGVAEARKKVFD